MIAAGFKGFIRLKQIIHEMSNNTLILEWQSIRLFNSHCSPLNDQQCIKCNFAYCVGYIAYEEVITDELMDRGLFDLAVNTCCNISKSKIQNIVNRENLQYFS